MTMVVLGRFGVCELSRKMFARRELHPPLRLRVSRSERRSYRLRHVRRSRAAEPSVEFSALTVVMVSAVGAWLAHGVLGVPPVVMAPVMTKVGDFEAGEEDGRDDEHDAGDDHNPRCESVEPIRFVGHGRWLGGDGGRPGWDFWCFAHTEIMRGQRIGPAGYNL